MKLICYLLGHRRHFRYFTRLIENGVRLRFYCSRCDCDYNETYYNE
jgi:hypothetical protein